MRSLKEFGLGLKWDDVLKFVQESAHELLVTRIRVVEMVDILHGVERLYSRDHFMEVLSSCIGADLIEGRGDVGDWHLVDSLDWDKWSFMDSTLDVVRSKLLEAILNVVEVPVHLILDGKDLTVTPTNSTSVGAEVCAPSGSEGVTSFLQVVLTICPVGSSDIVDSHILVVPFGSFVSWDVWLAVLVWNSGRD